MIKHSPYISWAKAKHGVRWNLARSGVPRPDPDQWFKGEAADILAGGEHEEGWGPLKERIASRYGVEAGQVVPVHGTSMANHLAVAALVEPDDHVLVESPSYEPLWILPAYFHAEVESFGRDPENDFQPDPGEIADHMTGRTRLVILSDLHNPSGMRVKPELLQEIAQLCEERGTHLLVDEVYLEFLYPQGVRTAASLSPAVITTRSLTKAYGLDDLRLGWMIASGETARRIRRLRDLYAITTAFPSERLGWHALGAADELLACTLALLEGNRKLVEDFVEGRPELSWTTPGAGSVGFVRLASDRVEELAELAEARYETIVAPGHFFGRPDHFRIGWGMPADELREGLRRLGQALEDLA
ncbi:MAG: aminotransferase class I/II-fold pyridoxal phosphate-dependent enzyme [Balneolaceae bacterium]|nr:aminotransferase class I/II-fold pyridoxal phosphate-dependent enzyme [Balneolaceae bacterium]